MSQLGESVFKAVDFLNEFLKDVSKLVTTVEEHMTSNKLAPLWGSASFWDHSHAYYSPAQWLPRYVARHYVEKPAEGQKPNASAPWFTFFNVYLTPKQIQEPIAVWGFGTQDEKEDLWEAFYKLTLNYDGPTFPFLIPTQEWKALEELPAPLSSFKYQARLVVELSDAQIVNEVVIQALLKEIIELRK